MPFSKGRRFGVPAFILDGETPPFQGVCPNATPEQFAKAIKDSRTPLKPETRAAFMKAVEEIRAAGATVLIDPQILPDSFAIAASELFPPWARITQWRSHLLDDRELWKKISAGDAEAFDAWYRQTAPRLRGFLRYCTGAGDSADDIMQDVYTQILCRPQGFDPDRGTLRVWLFAIVPKQAAEWRRKHAPSPQLI